MAQGQTSASELGQALVARRAEIDRAEAAWLDVLADFDRSGDYALDGHVSTVAWLVDRCGLARPTAKERVRVALELQRRPMLHRAFNDGDLSYSKVRAITRIVDGDAELDEALIRLARVGTTADLDRCVTTWQRHREQETPPDDRHLLDRVGVRWRMQHGGLTSVEVVLHADDAERLLRVLDAYVHRAGSAGSGGSAGRAGRPRRPDASDDGAVAEPAGTPREPDGCGAVPVEKDPLEPCPQGASAWTEPEVDPADAAVGRSNVPSYARRRADALLDLLELGAASGADEGLLDPQRAQVSVLVDYETLVERAESAGRISELDGGVPLTGDAARRLACDAGLVRIITRGHSEVLDLGRETRQWNRAQRRAIRARHGGRCAVAGCERRITQIHHCDPWGEQGRTDIACGIPVCHRHHRLVHEDGWVVAYDPATGSTTFTSPRGQTLTSPGVIRLPHAA